MKNVSPKLPECKYTTTGSVGPFADILYVDISAKEMSQVFDAFFAGMRDYSVNERGDVGSWVRLSCIRGLCSIIQDLILRSQAAPFPEFSEYLPEATYHRSVAEILKQGVERLDNVRQQAGEAFVALVSSDTPAVEGEEEWRIKDWESHRATFCAVRQSDPNLPDIVAQKFSVKDNDTSVHWGDGDWLFPKAVNFLNYKEYRSQVLRGFIASIASKTGSTVRGIPILTGKYFSH